MDSISHWLCSRTLKKLLCFSHFCFSNEVISKHRLVLSRLMPPLTILRTHPPRVFQTNSRRQKGNKDNLANHILLKGLFGRIIFIFHRIFFSSHCCWLLCDSFTNVRGENQLHNAALLAKHNKPHSYEKKSAKYYFVAYISIVFAFCV